MAATSAGTAAAGRQPALRGRGDRLRAQLRGVAAAQTVRQDVPPHTARGTRAPAITAQVDDRSHAQLGQAFKTRTVGLTATIDVIVDLVEVGDARQSAT